jgi:hypothetical protein
MKMKKENGNLCEHILWNICEHHEASPHSKTLQKRLDWEDPQGASLRGVSQARPQAQAQLGTG